MIFKKTIILLSILFTDSLIPSDVTTLFAHGAFAHPGQSKRFKNAFPKADNYKAVNFPDSQKETSWNPVNHLIAFLIKQKLNVDNSPSKAYFGSEKDVDEMKKYVSSHIDNKQPLVLFGCCRGGLAFINYLGQLDLAADNVKALVMEGTPANVAEAYNNKFGKYGIPMSVSERLFRALWSAYPKNAKPTLEAIKDIKNKELPVLILHSQEDQNFPFFHALKLYKKFKEEGFRKVYIAPLKGQHAFALRDDKDNYLKAVNSFYRHNTLPYDSKYAKEDMLDYDYDLEKAQQVINEQESSLKKYIYDKQQEIFPFLAYFRDPYGTYKK